MSSSESEFIPVPSMPSGQTMEDFFTNRLAENLGIDPSEITPELLYEIERQVEFDLHPAEGSIPANQNFLTHREILERRSRVLSMIAKVSII